jgi:hypothetical protein
MSKKLNNKYIIIILKVVEHNIKSKYLKMN